MPSGKDGDSLVTTGRSGGHTDAAPPHNAGGHASHYRPDIDGLRAIAVLSVVIFHAGSKKMTGGFVGVDVFFVISGYLISQIILRGLADGRFSFLEFYVNRIRRIFPALIVVLVTTWCLGWFVLLDSEYRALGKHIVAGSIFASNFALWGESGYFNTAAELKPLLHLWSLGVEEQFYLIWPFALFLAWKRRLRIDILLLVVGVISFAINIQTTYTSAESAFFLPFSRFWELMLGGMLAYLQLHGVQSPGKSVQAMRFLVVLSAGGRAVQNLKAFAGLAMILAATFVIDGRQPYPGWAALVPTLGAAMLISSGMDAWINRIILASRPLVFIGLISYPLYLWHWPLLSLLRIIEWGKPARGLVNETVLISIGLAYATYILVEKPIRFGRFSSRPWRMRAAVALSFGICAIGGLGLLTFMMNGIPSRNSISDISDVSEKRAQLKREADSDAACENFIGKDRKLDFCRLSLPQTPPSVAVIGDSHAHAVFPGFADFLSQRGVGSILLGSIGCPPLLNTTVIPKGEPWKKSLCPTALAQQIDVVSTTKSIRTVILVSRGPFYIAEGGFGPAEDGMKSYFDYKDDRQKSGLERFGSGLEDTIRDLSARGKAIYFLLQVPELGFEPEYCFGRRVQFSRVRRNCAVDQSEVQARQSSYRALVRSFQSRYPNFHVLDPFPLMCNGEECKAIIDNQLIYSDDDHLSTAGSKLVVSGMAPFLSGMTDGK
jgi:peptidoglycan/LPS O-acetylase OafA/YrhL